MNETEAVLTLKLISLGYAHSDALRDEAIRVVLAEVERLKQLADRSIARLVDATAPGSIGAFAARDAAEARVKELEAEVAACHRQCGDYVEAVQLAEEQVERLRADLEIAESKRSTWIKAKSEENKRLRAELKQHVEDALVVVRENERLRAAAQHVIDVQEDPQIFPAFSNERGKRLERAIGLLRAALAQPEAEPSDPDHVFKNCDRDGRNCGNEGCHHVQGHGDPCRKPKALHREAAPKAILDRLVADAQDEGLLPEAAPNEERIYPCDDCGILRTKSEGGTTFTVCEECWDKHYHPAPKEER